MLGCYKIIQKKQKQWFYNDFTWLSWASKLLSLTSLSCWLTRPHRWGRSCFCLGSVTEWIGWWQSYWILALFPFQYLKLILGKSFLVILLLYDPWFDAKSSQESLHEASVITWDDFEQGVTQLGCIFFTVNIILQRNELGIEQFYSKL